MDRRYVTADVFTDTQFSGNPVAIVLDAQGLSSAPDAGPRERVRI